MNLLDSLRTSKRTEDTAQLLRRFQTTTEMIQAISNSLQGLQSSRGGSKKHKKHRKTRKTRKNKKNKHFKGGFTYGTSSSFRKKSNKSSSSSLFNKNKKSYRKIHK